MALTHISQRSRVWAHRCRTAFRGHLDRADGRLLACSALILFGPAILIALACGARIRRTPRVGRHGELISDLCLLSKSGRRLPAIGWTPQLISIARGELAWVGPEARIPGELDLRQEEARQVASVLPGVVCTWRLRKKTSVAYDGQIETDQAYVANRTVKKDAGILLRSMLTWFYGSASEPRNAPPVTEILGVPLDNITMEDAIERILKPAASEKVRQVSFVNVDCVNKAMKDEQYRQVLATSDLRFGDGIGLRVAGKILKSEIRQNVNGTDLFPRLCRQMEEQGLSLFLLGGRPGIPERVRGWIAEAYPTLRVAGLHHGYLKPEQEPRILDAITRSDADVLLVAFGAPLQEKWIRRNRERLRVRAALGVGGLFDFYSGNTPRAPQWLRELGLEWVYRLCQEPGRMWKRYLVGNAAFLARVFVAKMRNAGSKKGAVVAGSSI